MNELINSDLILDFLNGNDSDKGHIMITNTLDKLTFKHLNDNSTPIKFRKIPFDDILPDPAWAERQKPLVKRQLSNWSLIEMTGSKNAGSFVVGSADDGEWVTSCAVDIPPAFAPDFSGVITPSGSYYELGGHNDGDPRAFPKKFESNVALLNLC